MGSDLLVLLLLLLLLPDLFLLLSLQGLLKGIGLLLQHSVRLLCSLKAVGCRYKQAICIVLLSRQATGYQCLIAVSL